MLKLGRTIYVCNRASRLGSGFEGLAFINAARQKPNAHTQIRCLSAGDVFGKVDLTKMSNLPDSPLPLPDKASIADMVSSGHSVLNELGLFSWLTPPSYLRWALESLHLYADVPWWLAIVTVSASLRLLTIYVPIKSQKNVALQSQYRPELEDFKKRTEDAKMEGDNMLVQQVMLEQHRFMKSKGINMMAQAGVLLANGVVFLSNFFAIKKMASANFPGFENGGILWFPNLLEVDPYMGLPALAAASTFAALKIGIDTGTSSNQMTPGLKLAFQYGFPALVFVSGFWFPSAICVHWVVSNTFSLALAGLFKIEGIRKILKIPRVVPYDKSQNKNAVTELWKGYRQKKAAPPSLSSLRKSDYDTFKKAGTGKPTAL
ncbi:Inner membrane protein [Aphelenchoides bicaudatus]|nr:Inner membrane protein [Aphelenchoides bicaudatus]